MGITAIAGDHQLAGFWQRQAKLLNAGERDDSKPLLFFLLLVLLDALRGGLFSPVLAASARE